MTTVRICCWLLVALLSLFGSTALTQEEAHQEHRHGHAHDHGHGHDNATSQHRFEDPQTWADRFEDPARDAWQLPERIVAKLITADDMIVADIGSATGYFPVRFARACPEGLVIGSDIEAGMVVYLNDRARKEGFTNLVSVLATADDPQLPTAVDLVFICNTYHHIDSRTDYFERLRQQLRADGVVAVVDFRPESSRGPRHKLEPSVVEAEMNAAGYELLDQHDFLPEQYFLVFCVKDGG